MSVAAAQAMLDNGFGIDVAMATPLGTLYNKNGLVGECRGRDRAEPHIFLPRDMELVVLATSPLGSPAEFFRDAVTNIYVDNIRPLLVLEQVSP